MEGSPATDLFVELLPRRRSELSEFMPRLVQLSRSGLSGFNAGRICLELRDVGIGSRSVLGRDSREVAIEDQLVHG